MDPMMNAMCSCSPTDPLQDQIDQYIQSTAFLLSDQCEIPLDEDTARTLRLGVNIMNMTSSKMQELAYYKRKFTKVRPDDMEMSVLKKCYIGKCKCGQFLIEERDRCCPKCNQFIDWTPEPTVYG